jgi:hypothetical protein
MSNILMPTPGPERRRLTADLPVLRVKLEQQRRLCIQRLAELTAEDQPLLLRHASTWRDRNGVEPYADGALWVLPLLRC